MQFHQQYPIQQIIHYVDVAGMKSLIITFSIAFILRMYTLTPRHFVGRKQLPYQTNVVNIEPVYISISSIVSAFNVGLYLPVNLNGFIHF